MNGYCTLESSSPPVVAASGKTRRSLELTNTKETEAWEGLAIGAVTLARTFSTGSQRFCRSGSQRSSRGGGLPGALRRAFSMRRPPAGPCSMGDGYWRIHDMDGDSDRGGVDTTTTLEEHAEEAEAEVEENGKNEEKKNDEVEGDDREEGMTPGVAVEDDDDDANMRNMKKEKKRGGIFKACKKLLRL